MEEKFVRLHDSIENSSDNRVNIREITAIKNGKVVYEDYWKGYKKGDALNIMSVTKSIISLLMGIAIDKGYVGSTEDNVMKYFPDYVTKRGEKTIYDVKIKHLLTMTAPYKYKSEPWTRVCTSDNWTTAALDLLGGKAGITGEFKYATLGIQIASGIITKTTGMSSLDFANKYLFEPLGIEKIKPHGDSSKEDQLNFVMNKEPRIHEWYIAPNEEATAGWGLTLGTSDMAKIGLLCLKNGEYEGKRIVSKKWIEEMSTVYVRPGEKFGNMGYGYLWWIPDEKRKMYAAIGDGGNIIYINPEENVVVAVAGIFKPLIFDRVEFIEKDILPLL